jgi:hypothetical protein
VPGTADAAAPPPPPVPTAFRALNEALGGGLRPEGGGLYLFAGRDAAARTAFGLQLLGPSGGPQWVTALDPSSRVRSLALKLNGSQPGAITHAVNHGGAAAAILMGVGGLVVDAGHLLSVRKDDEGARAVAYAIQRRLGDGGLVVVLSPTDPEGMPIELLHRAAAAGSLARLSGGEATLTLSKNRHGPGRVVRLRYGRNGWSDA